MFIFYVKNIWIVLFWLLWNAQHTTVKYSPPPHWSMNTESYFFYLTVSRYFYTGMCKVKSPKFETFSYTINIKEKEKGKIYKITELQE